MELDGCQWFNTGDVVAEDDGGFLCFHGRKRRFVKRAGEMISLPAIEAVLASHIDSAAADGPVLAITALGDDTATELVLFTTLSLDRQEVNRRLRDAGMSPLHSVQRVVKIAEIPVLGTGKTDYRALHELSIPTASAESAAAIIPSRGVSNTGARS
jgi:long-chain-fatty-acid--[acyl-carrier-protein] ligase